jgi:hypothetical protein
MSKKLFGWIALAVVLVAFAGTAWADIAPPRDLNPYKLDPKTGHPAQSAGSTQFSIVQSSDTDVVRLQIPRSVLANLQANGGTTASNGITPAQTRTLFAGVFLSFAMAFGGVWVLRSRKSAPARAVAMLMIAFAVAGTATTAVWANAGPPGRVIFPPGTLPKALKNDTSLDGTVVYEVVDDGNIRLVIPTNEVKRK